MSTFRESPSCLDTVERSALPSTGRTAVAVSNLGDAVMLAARPLLVATLTTDPVAVSAAMFAQQLPWLLFALTGGALADRLPRRARGRGADVPGARADQRPVGRGAIMAVFGVHAIVWGSVSATVRQRATPLELLGRVGSVYQLASVGGSVIGALLGGFAAARFGLFAPFWFAFALVAVMAGLAWRRLADVRVNQTVRQ